MSYVEKLARAIYAIGNPRGEWGTATSLTVNHYLHLAHDALDATAAIAPETGVKLTSRDAPARALLDGDQISWPYRDTSGDLRDLDCWEASGNIWEAMHDAAPAIPEGCRGG